ncbi:hypothetical protein LOTGIDRAFT_171342 [Lottia gigantea]|uniref:Uncharacterized protein n=1 Tax=Lottia gigantea TaxID=225164 RepID=V4B0G1_LOTGI|nr:hypothetical protein LOTGIDRAFT_171342 [Lottia gigantea]ESP03548.1 hypothetical protein LOTGIDRAFT_171342 [Lottia gigantea]
MELESRQQYMIDKQNELKVKLEQYNKCKKRWIRVYSVFKTLSVVLTVGTTVATALIGGLMVPLHIPTLLATITAIQTSSCGLIAKGKIEIDGEIFQDGKHKQDMHLVGFNGKSFHKIFSRMDLESDAFDWYFTRRILLRKDNFNEIKRSKVGRGTELLKKINEYIGKNCYIPTYGNCFIKCVNYVLNKDLTNEFQNFINGFSKSNRKGVMTFARINEFNKKCDTSFQIYTHNNRNLRPTIEKEELDWVLCFLFAWDCETYSEK